MGELLGVSRVSVQTSPMYHAPFGLNVGSVMQTCEVHLLYYYSTIDPP